MYTMVEFDYFDLSLLKVTVCNSVLLNYSVYTEVNHGTFKIGFSIFMVFVV